MTKPKSLPGRKNSTGTDWLAIRQEYIQSTLSAKQLAEKHGISFAAVNKRCQREGWVALKQEAVRRVAIEATEVVVASRVSELSEFNSQDIRMAKALRAIAAQRIIAAGNAGARVTPSDLNALARVIETAQKIGRLALGATTGNTGVSAPDGGPVQSNQKVKFDDLTDEELLALASASAGGTATPAP